MIKDFCCSMLCSCALQIQRTPLVVRTGGATFMNNMNHPQQSSTDWTQSSHRPPTHSKSLSHRPSFVNYTNPTGERSGTTSRSASANELEHKLKNQQLSRPSIPNGSGWRTTALQAPPIQRNSKYHSSIYHSTIPQYVLNEN